MANDEKCGFVRMRELSESIKDAKDGGIAERTEGLAWAEDDAHESGDAVVAKDDVELELLRVYARSWNNLSFEQLEHYLSDDVVYTSQSVLGSLVGKVAVSEYLSGKMKAVKENLLTADVYAEVGYCGNERGRRVQLFGSEGRPCVLMAQGDIKVPIGLVLLETTGNKIKDISFCTVVPDSASAIRTGEYPE